MNLEIKYTNQTRAFLFITSVLVMLLTTALVYYMRLPLDTDKNGLKIICYVFSYQLIIFSSLTFAKDKILSDCTKLLFITFFTLVLLASFALLQTHSKLALSMPYLVLTLSLIYFYLNGYIKSLITGCYLDKKQLTGVVLALMAFIVYVLSVLYIHYMTHYLPNAISKVFSGNAPFSSIGFLFILSIAFLFLKKFTNKENSYYFAFTFCFLFLIWLVAIVAQTSINIYSDQIFSPELNLIGVGHQDSYFHQTIINAIVNFKIPATMLDGIILTKYHVASHFVFAGLQLTSGIEPSTSLMFVRILFVVPMMFTVISLTLYLASSFINRFIYILFLFFIIVFVGSYAIDIYDSVGQSTATIICISALPLFYYHLKNNISPNYLTIIAFVCAALWCLLAKVSMGYAFIIAIGSWMLVYHGITKKLIVFSVLCLLEIGLAYKIVAGMGYQEASLVGVIKLLVTNFSLRVRYELLLALPMWILFISLLTKKSPSINTKTIYLGLLFFVLCFFPIIILKIEDYFDIFFFVLAYTVIVVFISIFILSDVYYQRYLPNNKVIFLILLIILFTRVIYLTNWYGKLYLESYPAVLQLSLDKNNTDNIVNIKRNMRLSKLHLGTDEMLLEIKNSYLAQLTTSLMQLPKKLCKNKVSCIGIYIPASSEYYTNTDYVMGSVSNLFYFPASLGYPLFYGAHGEKYYADYSFSKRAAYGSNDYTSASRPKNDVAIKTVCKRATDTGLDYLVVINKIKPNQYYIHDCNKVGSN